MAKIPYVIWRNGRPRFIPSQAQRKAGHTGHDLKNVFGEWMTEEEARDWSERFTEQLRNERKARRNSAPARVAPVPRHSYTVADMLRDWLGSVEVASKAQNTIRDYRQKVRVLKSFHEWIERVDRGEPAANDKAPDKVDRAIAMVWTSEAAALDVPICFMLYEQLVRKRRLHTANAVLRTIGTAFTYAQKKGKVNGDRRNPAYKLGKVTPKVQVRWAEPAEIETLIATADRLGRHEIGDMVALGVWIGQRQADRLSLQMNQIKQGRIELTQQKTNAPVSIAIAPDLDDRLKAAAMRRRKAEIIRQHVIVDEVSWQPFKADWYRHVYASVRKEAAKEMPSVARLNDKDLRATAVCWLARAGCTNTEIASITGHTLQTVDQILKHYWAANRDQADSAMNKLIAWHSNRRSTEPKA